ncbi:GNAT family N-acetyltransferase [Robertkochia solimangrovi]|uniref:GNAT family N-acetyltransferase n=1 Tax=Robertkochia solimangrovi TaxID=2213046 RepID=UPI00117BFD95|nr:GNAT family protein [Robertkochia solimangrovi]TRZ41055.1 GNAT family N-acetyltransferase [Robertkochia solimangrovi]
MKRLTGDKCYLRALEPEDLDFLYKLENDESVWEVSETVTPYSRYLLKEYLENSHRDIYDVKQLRLAICSPDGRLLGFVDLFDFDPKNGRAGVGIIVLNKNDRNQGIGHEALQLLSDYAFRYLELHQLYANIGAANKASIRLFESLGFELIGVKKEWTRISGKFCDELFYQKINDVY